MRYKIIDLNKHLQIDNICLNSVSYLTKLISIMYIPQKNLEILQNAITPGKVCIIYGARRVGKTTLLEKFLENTNEKYLFVTGDDISVRDYLESQSIQKLKDFVGDHKFLIIDEAQQIRQIGLNLKIIVDHISGIKVIATGSSSFDLAKDIGEPLTGRKITLRLFPLAQMEISKIEQRHETSGNLESRLIYGAYPEIVVSPDKHKREGYLREMISSYLFKDILELEGIRHSNKLIRLLQLLAFQIGRQVSSNELGNQLQMSKNTVDRYLDLLEKVFIIYKRSSFSGNLRKELSKSSRYYFFDNGIRNALIGNFNPLSIRNDVGELWENYIVTERLKRNEYLQYYVSSYFWRTYSKSEIDLVEMKNAQLSAYEIKWQNKKVKIPGDWSKTYPGSGFSIVHKENYLDFIC